MGALVNFSGLWGADLWDIDSHQRELYQLAGFDPDTPVHLLELCRGLQLRVVLVSHPSFPNDGELRETPDGWTIFLRRSAPRVRRLFACAHEVAEWALRRYVDERIEDACNALAAAILAPRRAFQRRIREVGERDYEQLAFPFGLTETSAVLRLGETRGVQLAVVTPHRVYARGEWQMHDGQLRRIARDEQMELPGLRKARLRDDPKRVVLVAEDFEIESA